MESARQVQALLVPTRFPITPHFRFEAAYYAASEVGGDFYQVLPQTDGALLVMVGDVSGKGLKAAMHGTLIVGAFRALAQEEFSPVKILGRLNLQLAASSGESIATCLVLHLTPEGRGVFANAGHLAPYCNGKEIPCSSGLPLGLMPHNEYIESVLQLVPGEKLTLLSDGVVEARNHAGELFGFERTLAISGESAQTIAEVALSFGQEDDITVLTVTMAPAAVSST
jgi:serine phosphatase RsbU (regulator of sigma subunit)